MAMMGGSACNTVPSSRDTMARTMSVAVPQQSLTGLFWPSEMNTPMIGAGTGNVYNGGVLPAE